MKTLLVLRHAKSDQAAGSRSDHDRPLNDRGRRDAPRMARRLADAGLTPDRIVCSTAVRARETAALFVEATGFGGPVDHHQRLYLAPVPEILAVLASLDAATVRPLLVGHNPGLEELLAALTGWEGHLPTAALARVELPIADWTELRDSPRGRFVDLWTPKDSFADEGPERV